MGRLKGCLDVPCTTCVTFLFRLERRLEDADCGLLSGGLAGPVDALEVV